MATTITKRNLKDSPIIVVTRPDGQPAEMREDLFVRLEHKGFKRGYTEPKPKIKKSDQVVKKYN